MCGIAGKVNADGPVDPALVERMCALIEHRGPDSRGIFADTGVCLGIQRLAIIDLETGDQPIFNEDRTVVVVLNGEIYNYRELRAELRARGHHFRTESDTEAIVHLYEELGEACVERLRGMFAFALWDARRERLLLARDRVGKKPLFYAKRGGALWFGSEPRTIVEDPEVPRDVDFDAVDSFLMYQYVPHPMSAFRALRKLPPAHTLTWENGRIETRRYWKLRYGRKLDASEDELQEMIRERLLEATRLRLRSDVPLGALLSGGVDSSAVVAAMARQAPGRVKTFSIGFDVGAFDETAHAREIAGLFDTDHHELRVEPAAMDVLPKLVWHYGEPFADASAIPSFYLAEMTRRHVTVALNGDGGDESFAGYRRYYGNRVAARLDRVPQPLAQAAAGVLDRIGTGPQVDTLRARLGRLAHAVAMTPYERYAMWVAYFTEADRAALYRPEFLEALGRRSAPDVIRGPWMASDAPDLVDRLLDVDVETYLPGDLLVKMDIATMAHSLEVRSPLLDHELMELAAAIPSHMKLDGRTTKRIFKDALRPWIPDRILDRSKQGFEVPIREWFRGPLRDLPAEILLDRRSVERGFFREEAVRGLIDAHHARSADNSSKLWTLIQLELWLRMYVDGGAGVGAETRVAAY
jgi:asparagine synthase (glutamine-hydrolysing)